MWLLENEEAFQGRRLWLRPGKTYLFGRTVVEPGQLAISHNTISRKHLTITVDPVDGGHAHDIRSRSKVTIEDLATKIGTVVDGQKLKGEKYVVPAEEASITMGKCPKKFRLIWFPVVFTFSFTSKELQHQPLTSLQAQFEQLDIKLFTDYSVQDTTHVVSKKRNTAKGLQALINGKHIVTESFLDAIVSVAEVPSGEETSGSSSLEDDFDAYWPNALDHLPPRGGEPVDHPNDIYAPDLGRKDVFEGYTFVFYDKTQYNNLLAPITNGGGKALIHVVNPDETQVDDFVRYIKEVAGEKGLGCFDDGSEGKGVVLVRYLPAKGDIVKWYTDFLTTVSIRLDHRPIEQNEFLEAILIKDASKLRRPLEVESSSTGQNERTDASAVPDSVPGSIAQSQNTDAMGEDAAAEKSQLQPKKLLRQPYVKRFAGFDDDDDDIDMDSIPPAPIPRRLQSQDAESGLFVSQEDTLDESTQNTQVLTQRKRAGSSLLGDDLMEGMAPAVAKFKKQRIERGEDFAAPSPSPEPEEAPVIIKKEKKSKEIDILAIAAKNREAAEARARAEREDLENLPEGLDLAEIRRLNLVEEIELRSSARGPRSREQEIADGRWDPKWNGVKNFKKFRKRGETTGRQPARVIITLTEVKTKEFGVGDNYWLEDADTQRKKAAAAAAAKNLSSRLETPDVQPEERSPIRRNPQVVADDSSDVVEDDDEDEDVVLQTRTQPPRRGAASQTQRSTRSATTSGVSQTAHSGKRAAPEPVPSREPPPTKRPRPPPRSLEVQDSEGDDSDDELKFRFGKRR